MGFESKISGYIAIHSNSDPAIMDKVKEYLNKLPRLENDKWPFLPRDIFKISKPLNPSANSVQISYKSIMIHFAMSIKQLDDDLEGWLGKFQNFFKQLPNSYEAKVDINLSPYTGNYKFGQLSYYWTKKESSQNNTDWIFKGDSMTLKGVLKPINFKNFTFSENFKSEIIKALNWIGDSIGDYIEVSDKISTNKGNYDKHFTRGSKFKFKLIDFGVRTSGAIARLEGENITFEFKTDSARSIVLNENSLEIELNIDVNSSRLIRISKVK